MNRSEKAKTAAAPARRNVPHRICVFLKETFLTLRFAEGALLCCGIYVLGDLVWWGAESFLYVFGASTLFSSFIYLFPVCAAFPYALRYRENRKNHLDYMILQRCSVFRYLNTLFVRTAVSGFAVMAAGTLLFLGLIPVCFPHAVLSYELEEIGGLIMPFLETVAQAENWFAYFGFYTLLIGISGVFLGRSGPDRLRMGGQHVCDLHFSHSLFVRDGLCCPPPSPVFTFRANVCHVLL